MNSSISAHYFLKFASVMFAMLGILILHAYFFPEFSLVDRIDEGTPINISELISYLVIILFLVWGAFSRLGRVLCNDNGVTLIRNGKTTIFTWGEIKSVQKIPFTAPPLYRISFVDDTTPVYFMMSLFFHAYIETPISIHGSDFSGFKKYAQYHIEQSKGS